jgi:hypothetical protein
MVILPNWMRNVSLLNLTSQYKYSSSDGLTGPALLCLSGYRTSHQIQFS